MQFHCIKMRYSIEPKDKICETGYWFLSFLKNTGKKLGNKYVQKRLDSAQKSIKTASKREIQKTAEATGGLIGNKLVYKITSVSKKSPKKLQNDNANDKTEVPKKDTY